MTKYKITIYNTVTYAHTVEVEADSVADAEEAGWNVFEDADCAADWECADSNAEMDIEVCVADHKNETEIIDRMREAVWSDNQPPRD